MHLSVDAGAEDAASVASYGSTASFFSYGEVGLAIFAAATLHGFIARWGLILLSSEICFEIISTQM
jgi:hypothetical protein